MYKMLLCHQHSMSLPLVLSWLLHSLLIFFFFSPQIVLHNLSTSNSLRWVLYLVQMPPLFEKACDAVKPYNIGKTCFAFMKKTLPLISTDSCETQWCFFLTNPETRRVILHHTNQNVFKTQWFSQELWLTVPCSSILLGFFVICYSFTPLLLLCKERTHNELWGFL